MCFHVKEIRKAPVVEGVYGLSALRNLVLTKFNDRQVSLYYKIGYYSVISYMYLI